MTGREGLVRVARRLGPEASECGGSPVECRADAGEHAAAVWRAPRGAWRCDAMCLPTLSPDPALDAAISREAGDILASRVERS